MPGPPPNENRRRRNADTYAGVTPPLVDDGQLCGPALEGQWSDHARAYWDTWRLAPQAKIFLPTDWMRLRMLVPLVERYMSTPDPRLLAEIRQNEGLLGGTLGDRIRGRMKVVQPTPEAVEAPAGVTALDEYRRNLAG